MPQAPLKTDWQMVIKWFNKIQVIHKAFMNSSWKLWLTDFRFPGWGKNTGKFSCWLKLNFYLLLIMVLSKALKVFRFHVASGLVTQSRVNKTNMTSCKVKLYITQASSWCQKWFSCSRLTEEFHTFYCYYSSVVVFVVVNMAVSLFQVCQV